MTLWEEHLAKWSKGCGSCLCSKAQQVVFGRGTIPCDVAFIGEAPGVSENVIGQPFVGPAGHLLDHIVKEALGTDLSCMFCNLTNCIPLDENNVKATEPPAEAIKQCRPRLVELIRIAQPRLIVTCGELPKKNVNQKMFEPVDWLVEGQSLHFANIRHPAYIIRLNVAMRGLEIRRCIVALQNAVQEIREGFIP